MNFLGWNQTITTDRAPFTYNSPNIQPFDTNSDPTTFSQKELGQISEIWARVSEDYSIFNVNVTISSVLPTKGQGLMIVIGTNNGWYAGGGGVAAGFSFSNPFHDNIGFAFVERLGENSKYIAEATSHEAGHLSGLYHQSDYTTSPPKEYRAGDGTLGPIMGLAYYDYRSVWDNKSTTGINVPQDELAQLSSVYGLKAEDHSQSFVTADKILVSPVSFSFASIAGVITTTQDTDTFVFRGGGLTKVNVNVASTGPNLDSQLDIYDSNHNILASSNPGADIPGVGLSSSFELQNLPFGNYYIVIKSNGGYGDLGQYYITGQTDPTYDLVFDMNNQPFGNDGILDSILIVNMDGVTGNKLLIYVNGSLVISDQVDFIRSLKIIGSNDPESINMSGLSYVKFKSMITIDGGAGDDTIYGSVFNDLLIGGPGDDLVLGGQGDDELLGGLGVDQVMGEQGRDTIGGGANNDNLFGGDEFDVFLWSAGDGNDTVDGGTGSDETYFTGTAGSDCFKLSFFGIYAKIDVDPSGSAGIETSYAADVEHVLFLGFGGADAYLIDTVTTTPVELVGIVMGGDGSANIATVQLPNIGASVNATPSSDVFGSVDVNGLSAMVTIFNSSPVDTLDIIGGYGHDQIEIPVETLALISIQADGMGGNDLIRGAQTAMGGSGDDTIFGTDGNDVFLGGLGNDRIEGLAGNDLILGDGTATGVAAGVPGNNGPGIPAFVIDVYSPLGGNDTILGGDGADTINGGAGNDSIDGGDGADTIGVLIVALTPILPSGFMEPGNDLISGGLGDDSIQAGDGNDSVFGNEGQDLIAGQAGNDTIDGGTGHDTIFGNEDNDSILGGDGKDSIDGGTGDDHIAGNNDEDSILGGSGADTIDGGDGADILFGNDGSDSILGGLANDTIDGGLGDDSIAGDSGDDSVLGGIGNDTISGGDGNDVIQGNAGDDSILGGLGLDSIHGGLGADFISGDAGNDSLCGGPDDSEKVDPALDGSDTIFGGSGNDAVNGDAGDDFLNGGDGNDQLWGSDGQDTIGVFVYNGVTQFEPGNDSLIGGLGDDLIAGALVDSAGKPVNDGNDVMFGQEGNDTIWGGAGGDMIYGGDGDDVMLGGTPLTANTLHAPRNGKLPNDGNDTMFGGNGFDKVDGGNNNNLLDAGNDGIRETVLGGKGNDMGYSHTLQDPVKFDVLALDGGFNHKFCDGGLEEPPVPAASCTYIDWAIPSNYFTGVKTLKNGDIVEHPSLDYRTKPNNGPNGPVIKSVKIQSSKVTVSKTTLVKSAVSKSSTSFAGKSKTVGKLSSGLSKLQVAKG